MKGEQLRAKYKNVVKLSKQLGEALILLSPDCNIFELNEPAAKILSCDRERVLGQNFSSIVSACKAEDPLKGVNLYSLADGAYIDRITSLAASADCPSASLHWRISKLSEVDDSLTAIMLTLNTGGASLLGVASGVAAELDSAHLQEFIVDVVGKDLSSVSLSGESVVAMKEFYENMIAHMPGYVYWKDINSVYLGCNDLLASVSGLQSRDDIVGKTDEAFGWAHNQVKSFREDDLEVMRSGKAKSTEHLMPIVRSDGMQLRVLTNKVPLLDSRGDAIGILGIATDITEQKLTEVALERAKEQAEIANQAKSDFMAMMTHELRTPLNVMLGMTQIMQTEDCSSEDRETYLKTIFQSGKSLLGIINDILDFAKAQSGKLDLHPEAFDLDALLEQLKTEFNVKGAENGVEYIVKKDPRIPQYLFADDKRLRQIIYNLSDNAMKFTTEGSVSLILDRVVSSSDDLIGVQVQIKDTGIGIPKEKLHSVFEEFTQVSTDKHTEYSRKYGGVGLGLAIVRQLIELMDAEVSVDSDLGEGTTFTCKFEMKLPSKQQLAQIKEQSESQLVDHELPPSKILLVEDNLLNQKVATHMLKRFNCDVDIANDGTEALAKLRNQYDLVFMDMSLPGMSGVEVTEEYRSREKGQRKPIVALSANVHEDDRKKCLGAGMDDFLTKPIMLDELHKTLNRWIASS